MRSMTSNAVDAGNMLDIKSITPLPQYLLSSPRLLPLGMLQPSVYARFLQLTRNLPKAPL